MSNHISVSKITINASADRVWEALTRPELVKQWQYGTDLITDWQPGSPILFRNEWNGTVFEQKGTVLEVQPPERVRYTLFAPRPDLEGKPENYFIMTYLLEETNGKTILSIIQDDPRPGQQGSQEHEEEGENSILEGLKKLVEG